MSSKRARGQASRQSKGKSIAFDDPKFVSVEAKQRFEHATSIGRNCTSERGFGFEGDDDHYDGITGYIDALGWREFCKHPKPAIKAVVMEFYANAAEAVKKTTLVRGKTVRFDARTINEYYLLDNDLPGLMELEFDAEEAKNALTQVPTTWDRDKQGIETVFPGTNLELTWRLWQLFICAKLMPTTHYSELDRDRCRALWAIRSHVRFNVGAIISEQIKYCASQTATNYVFPHLITELCREAGVEIGTTELVHQPRPKIEKKFIDKLRNARHGTTEKSSKVRKGKSPFDQMTQKQQLGVLYEEVKHLKDYNTQFTSWANQQARYQSQMAEFQAQVASTTLALLQSSLNPSTQQPPVELPTMPIFPGEFQYIPDEEEDMDEDDE